MLELRGVYRHGHGFTSSLTSAGGVRWAMNNNLGFRGGVVREVPELPKRVTEFKKLSAAVAGSIAGAVKTEEEQMWIAQKEKRVTVLGDLSQNEDLHPNVGKFLVSLPNAGKFVHARCMIRYADVHDIPVVDSYELNAHLGDLKQVYRERLGSLLSVEAEQFASRAAQEHQFPLFGTALLEYGTAAVYASLQSIEVSDPEAFSAAVQRFVRTSVVLSSLLGWDAETWDPVIEAINNPVVNWSEPVGNFNIDAKSYMDIVGCYQHSAFRPGQRVAVWGQEDALKPFQDVQQAFSGVARPGVLLARDLHVGQMSGIAPESWSLRILRDVKESDVPWLHALAVAWAPRSPRMYEYLSEYGQVAGLTHVNLQEVHIPNELRAAVLKRYIKVYSEHCRLPGHLLKDGDVTASLRAALVDPEVSKRMYATPINAYWRVTDGSNALQWMYREASRSDVRFLTVEEREQLMLILLLDAFKREATSARTQRDVLFAAIGDGNTLTDKGREDALRLIFHFQFTSKWDYNAMSTEEFCYVLHDAVNDNPQDARKAVEDICGAFDRVGTATGVPNRDLWLFQALIVFYIEKVHDAKYELFEAASDLIGSEYKGTRADFMETLDALAG